MVGGFSINVTPAGVESSYELRDVTYVEKLMLLDIVRRGLNLEAEDIHKFASLLDTGVFEDCFDTVTEEEFRNEN